MSKKTGINQNVTLFSRFNYKIERIKRIARIMAGIVFIKKFLELNVTDKS